LGALAYALGYGLCGLVTHERGLLGCVALITLAEIGVSPAQQSAATSLATFGRVGAYAGLFGFANMLGQSLGPLLGTGLLDLLPARTVWAILPVCGLTAAWCYAHGGRPPPRREASNR